MKPKKGAARAREKLEAGLARRDAELAVGGLLALALEEREAQLAAVAALFKDAVERARHDADWPRLTFWTARAEREPRLVGSDCATAWALLWGCARCREWARAQRWFEALRPALALRVPSLERALHVWLASEGRPPVEALAEFSPPAPPVDPRLGQEALHPRLAPPAFPQRAEDAEAAVFACCATQPWGVFAQTVLAWTKDCASPETARAIRLLAARLSVRELLQRQVGGDRLAFEPVDLLVRAAREAGFPEELRADLLLALRALLATPAARQLERPEGARALAGLALAIARWPEHRRFVLDAVATLSARDAATAGELLELARQLLRLERSAPLWGLAVHLWPLKADPRAPEWMWSSMRSLLGGENPLLAWLRAQPRVELAQVVYHLGLIITGTALSELLEGCWSGADDALRRAFGDLVLERLEVLKAFEELGAAGVAAGPGLQRKEDRALWFKCLQRVLPYDEALLQWALKLTESDVEARQATQLYLGGHSSITAMLEVLRALAFGGWPALGEAVQETMFRTYGNAPEELARAFRWGLQQGMPASLQRRMGAALVEAAAPKRELLSDEVMETVDEARRWAESRPGMTPPRKPSAKKREKKGGAGKSRASRQPRTSREKP